MVLKKAVSAKRASFALGLVSGELKNNAILKMADALERNAEAIFRANQKDVRQALMQKLSEAFIDRLTLNEKRLKEASEGLRQVAGLPDPVGAIIRTWQRPNGLQISRVRVPLGVVGIIFEARPNVAADATGLCLKAGNAVVLRGGSEAVNSNRKLVDVINRAGLEAGLPPGFVNFIETTDRSAVGEMLKLDKYIDVIIPRGGQKLIRFITSHSRIPVISHGEGNCHVYVDAAADLKMAEEIVFNAKIQRPGVCNAMEKLLVDMQVAEKFLPVMIKRLQAAGVEIRGCERTRKIVRGLKTAVEKDWYTEYLDLILAVKVVYGLDEAIKHINKYGSRHSDAIVTENRENARRFLREIDAAAVYVNASTRFTDGGQFGIGAEIGISTQKLHARGPMGVDELTCSKFVIQGEGQVRT